MTELNVWVKPDGTELKVNNHPANEAKATELKWKKKGEIKTGKKAKQ